MEITSSSPTSSSQNIGTISRLPFLLLIGLICWTIGWYWNTAVSIEDIWSKSGTFQHGYLIVPISLWLIWQRREWLSEIEPKPVLWPLFFIAALGLGWLLADLAQVSVIRQYTFVLMVPAIVTLLLGTRFARAMAFPLAFLLLAVPFGEFLIPPLMNFTADFTVSALRLTGIPVFREGNNFSLPTGNWSVVEACSGLRYLIASVTLGCLYAYLTYRRLHYRLICIVLSLLIPILANGLRAYMIVILGHVSGMQLAVGVDHLIYGWLFFGIVIMLMFWIGTFWREDSEPLPKIVSQNVADGSKISSSKAITAAVLGCIVIAMSPLYAHYLNAATNPVSVRLSELQINGWSKVNEPLSDWRPHYLKPRSEMNQVFEKNNQRIGVYIAYYNNQDSDAKLISSTNALTVSADSKWFTIDSKKALMQVNGNNIDIQKSQLRGISSSLQTWHWYWIKGTQTSNAFHAKFIQATSRLLKRGDDSAVIVLYTNADKAETVLQDFAKDAVPEIDQVLAKTDHN